jgi:hypothetical protein
MVSSSPLVVGTEAKATAPAFGIAQTKLASRPK